MTPASRLPVEAGDRVLDLCAAPGGKATALGAKLHREGVLVANDINQARAKALLRNLELFGLPNVFITNEPPHRMAQAFPEYFDKIMVDAPCSGEGMFRKNPAVIDAWLEKGPEYFSKLQRDIILYAFDMLKAGGKMFYSTCTFSPLENEAVITHLLAERPDAKVIPMEDYEGFSPGITAFGDMEFHPSCAMTRRIFPHKMNGEGHYMALIEKQAYDWAEEEEVYTKKSKKNKKEKKKKNEKEDVLLVDNFISELCAKELAVDILSHLEIRAEKAYYVPNPDFAGKGLHFLRNGVYLGDIKKNRFEPSEPFALMLKKDDCRKCLSFDPQDPRLMQYLRGESLEISDLLADGQDKKKKKSEASKWALVLAGDYAIGFGKIVGSTLKNKYPTGWRVN